MSGGVSTDFKSSNRIEISRIVQVLLNFEWFRGSPRGWGVGGWGWEVVRGCIPPTCTCTCMHAHAPACMCVWHHREFPGIPPMGAAICMKLSCLPHARVHACMCVCACACACVWGAPPNHPPPPSSHTPTPRAAGSPKHQNSISLQLIEIIRFCLKILYLWTFLNSYRLKLITPEPPHSPAPPPRAEETQIGRITITLEWIEIIQLCLKICDPWSLPHTYRLGLMCSWGVPYYKWHFYVFDPKKCSCDAPIKKFPIFALDSIRPYLDWALRGFLTS